MVDELIIKKVKCPNCGSIIELNGHAGEKKIITCEHCGLEGFFRFPVDETESVSTHVPYAIDVIEVKRLTKRYKDVVAVKDVSFSVKKGEIFGFLGPNGAGKTTTIRTLLGFLKPNQGQAFIFNKNVRDHIVDIRKNVGYIPGELNLYEHLTGRQCLQYFSSIRNTDLSLLDELLDIFQLPLDRKIKTYSRGMKQKLGIVQAFMDDPEIVIMDEPTSGLDPLLQQKFYRFLHNEKKKGRTMFFSSHILSEVDKVCDRVGIIRRGSLVALERVEDLKRKRGKRIRLKIKEDPKELAAENNAKLVDGWVEFAAEDDLDEVIKKIAQYTIVDLEVQEFSLEDIFMKYYDEGGDN